MNEIEKASLYSFFWWRCFFVIPTSTPLSQYSKQHFVTNYQRNHPKAATPYTTLISFISLALLQNRFREIIIPRFTACSSGFSELLKWPKCTKRFRKITLLYNVAFRKRMLRIRVRSCWAWICSPTNLMTGDNWLYSDPKFLHHVRIVQFWIFRFSEYVHLGLMLDFLL